MPPLTQSQEYWLRQIATALGAGTNETPTSGSGIASAYRLDSVNDSITAYPFGHNYSFLNTAASTVVKPTAGVLHSITITNIGSGGTPTITIYDNTAASGTIIAQFTAPAVGTYVLNVAFSVGLSVNMAATTTSPACTLTWR